MKMPLEISFGKSGSSQFTRAVHLAASLPGYHVKGEGRDVSHHVAFEVALDNEARWETVESLLHMISGWRSASVKIDGRPMRPRKLLSSVAQIKACHGCKLKHAVGEHYCSGKNTPTGEAAYFGCRLCDGVSRRRHVFPNRGASWIDFGTLSSQRDSFHVDKPAIFQVLEQQARESVCVLCPAFTWERVHADVDDLPDTITLDDNSSFEVRLSQLNPGKALGIQLKNEDGFRDGSLFHRIHDPSPNEENLQEKRCVPKVRYADVAGQDKALAAIRQVVQLPLTHFEYFAALNVEPQAGILLYGPPGNGKTLLAKAVATECQAHLEIINGPEILSKWVGESEANLRAIFARCRQLAPSVLLIDEIDSLAPCREWLSQQHDVQIIAQLLVLLDGLEPRGRVAVVATTNRLEALDPALRRPGRFDYHIEVPLPDRTGRTAILRVHLKKMRLAKHVRIHRLVKETEGFSGAEIAGVCREAGTQAILRGLASGTLPSDVCVAQDDLYAALEAWRSKRARSEGSEAAK